MPTANAHWLTKTSCQRSAIVPGLVIDVGGDQQVAVEELAVGQSDANSCGLIDVHVGVGEGAVCAHADRIFEIEVHPGLIEVADGVALIQLIVESERAAQGVIVDHGGTGNRSDESQLSEAATQGDRGAGRQAVGQLEAGPQVHTQHHVVAADIVEEAAVGGQAAILGSSAAHAGQAETQSSGQADGAEILDNGDLGIGKPLGTRRDADGSAVEVAIVGDGRVTLDPSAAERELGSRELGESGGVAEDSSGHVLRQGKADSGHAAGGGREHVLRVGSISLSAGHGVAHAEDEP